MQNINNSTGLKEAILLLEVQQNRQMIELKSQFKAVQQSFTPMNLIKSTFRDFKEAPDLKTNLLNTAIGLTTGILSKKLLLGGSHNPLLKIVGTLVEIGVAGIVTKHPEGIKATGMSLFKKIFSGNKS